MSSETQQFSQLYEFFHDSLKLEMSLDKFNSLKIPTQKVILSRLIDQAAKIELILLRKRILDDPQRLKLVLNNNLILRKYFADKTEKLI